MRNDIKKILLLLVCAVIIAAMPIAVKAAVKPTFKVTAKTMVAGNTFSQIISNAPSGAVKTWTSSSKNVATVNSKGVVTAKKSGTANIICCVKKGRTTKKLTLKVTVVSPSFKSKGGNILVGKSAAIAFKYKPAKATYTWSTSNKSIATVKNGKVSVKKKGSAIITCKIRTYNNTFTLTYKVIAIQGAKSVKITNPITSSYVGKTYTLKTQITDSSSNDIVSFVSSNTAVASVTSTGKLTIKKAGTAKITAKTLSNKTAAFTVKVATPSISVSKLLLLPAEKATLKMNNYCGNVTYISNNTNVATVEKTKGIVTAKKTGTATITVTAAGVNYKCIVTVTSKKIVHSGKVNKVTWSIDSDGTLVLSGEGDYVIDYEWSDDALGEDTYRWSYFDGGVTCNCPWLEYTNEIKKAVVDIKNQTVALCMFDECNLLESVDVSKWDTSKIVNMSGMFLGCSELKEVDVSKWNTSNVRYMSDLFAGCSSLKSIDVNNWNTSKTYQLYDMFLGCSSLENIDVSKWDVSNVEDMSYMFAGCNELKSIDVSNWNFGKELNYVGGISTEGMFGECSLLESIDVSKWDTSNVCTMSNMFAECTMLKEIDVSMWNTSNVEDMSYMFYGCCVLKEIDVSRWNTEDVADMSNMFSDCNSLESLDVTNWDVSDVEDMSYMFYKCISLKNIDISKWNIDSITHDNMFLGCSFVKL